MGRVRLFDEDANELRDIVPPDLIGQGISTEAYEGLATDSANQNAGLGLAQELGVGAGPGPGPVARTQSDRDFLDSLPTTAKIGLALQSFAAGYEGKPSPIDTLLVQRRASEKANRDQLLTTINTLDKGMNILRRLPQGSLQRKAVAAELGKVVGPQFAGLFEAAGSEDEDAVRSMISVVKDADVQQMILGACRNAPDQQACWISAIKDDSMSKQMYKAVDSKRLPDLQRKMRAVAESFKKEGKDSFTLAEIAERNAGGALFNSDEMGTIERNEAWFDALGLQITEAVREGAKARARAAERPDRLPTIGTIQEIKNRDGTTTQQRFKGTDAQGNLIWETVGGAPAKGNELTEAQMSKLRREKSAYENAMEQMRNFGINPDGSSSKPNIQKRLMPKIKPRPGSQQIVENMDYDPQFAGRVKAWLKATEAGDPYEREGIAEKPAAKPAAEARAVPQATQALPQAIVSRLKRGINTTLSDGSVWTLGADGKPKKVR